MRKIKKGLFKKKLKGLLSCVRTKEIRKRKIGFKELEQVVVVSESKGNM
jgi:hypothetical protein